jgi:chromosome segregation ATPase
MSDRFLLSDLLDPARHGRYVIVVAASDEALYRDLQVRFARDTRTRVILDRRRRSGSARAPASERRLTLPTDISSLGVAVIRLADDRPTKEPIAHEPAGRRERMEGIDGLNDRQRVDRWLEESQYLIGRMIPAYLDDRERVRARLESVEADNERLRIELADARRQMAELGVDLELLRTERARIADNFHAIVEHLTALQGPVSDVASRLHSGQTSDVKV